MMIVIHRILVLTTQRHELNMVLDYWSLIRANVSDLEHNQTHAVWHSYDPQYALAAYAGCS